MVYLRQVRPQDLDGVLALVMSAEHGLTSLPKDRNLVQERVLDACESFQRTRSKPKGDPYLFVLVDPASGGVLGTSGIISKVGGFEPFYTFRIETHVHESRMLGVRNELQCLHLLTEHSGPCEIGSLYLAPSQRRHGRGRLLSLSRLLYMAQYPTRFDPFVIAEMRGVVEDDGRCPFWEALGRHFFDMEFPEADKLSALDKSFISELIPSHPLYIPLLTNEAQAVLGKVHPRTEPALKMLQDEGFRDMGWIDLFDGGPVVGCRLREARTVRDSLSTTLGGVVKRLRGAVPMLLAAYEPEFRAVLTPVQVREDGAVIVGDAVARGLELEVGTPVRIAPPRPVTEETPA